MSGVCDATGGGHPARHDNKAGAIQLRGLPRPKVLCDFRSGRDGWPGRPRKRRAQPSQSYAAHTPWAPKSSSGLGRHALRSRAERREGTEPVR